MPVVSRRELLAGLAATGILTAAGCTSPGLPMSRGPRARPGCVAGASLPQIDSIGNAALHYEIGGARQSFRIDSGFRDQLEAWWADWLETTGVRATRIDTYGTWINGQGDCDSWHHAGRAFDIAQLLRGDDVVVSCREDVWSDASPVALAERRRGYWSLAAHLHIHFASVLTYLFDAAHRNHIHVDNGRSGDDLSTFRPGSRVQVHAVQATARWLFDQPIEVTGRYDAATRNAVNDILRALGRRGDLSSSDNWHTYLRAAARRG